MPSKILLIGAVISLTISTIVASVWKDGRMDDIWTVGLAHGSGNTHLLPIWVWLYCIFWWFVQDVVKVLTYKILDRYDLFQYRTISEGQWKPTSKTSKPADEAQQPLLKDGKQYGSVNH